MNRDKGIIWVLRVYIAIVILFIFAPIIASFIFSFNSDRFPSIPLGHFTLHWYERIWNDQDFWDAAQVSIVVAVTTSIIATFLGLDWLI